MPSAAPRLRLVASASPAARDTVSHAAAMDSAMDLAVDPVCAARARVLFEQFRALSQRLGRDEEAQREALGLTEPAWRAWVAAQDGAGAGAPASTGRGLAERIAWQNHLALGLLAVVARFGAEAVHAR